MRLDESHVGGSSRHLDISIIDVKLDGETWPSLKFKFFLTANDRLLEFREMPNWPAVFIEFPGSQRDAYGPVWWLSLRDIPAISGWRSERDKLLLQSVVALLPSVVEEAVGGSELSAEERQKWREEAAALSASYLHAMQKSRIGIFGRQTAGAAG